MVFKDGKIKKIKKMREALRLRNLKKYFIASLINTVIGVILIILIYKITNLKLITIGICSLLGYFYSILTYHRIAFKGKLSKPPYTKYAVTYISSFLLNSTFTRIGEKFLDQFLLVQLFVVPLVVFIQWIASNLWVFKSKK